MGANAIDEDTEDSDRIVRDSMNETNLNVESSRRKV